MDEKQKLSGKGQNLVKKNQKWSWSAVLKVWVALRFSGGRLGLGTFRNLHLKLSAYEFI